MKKTEHNIPVLMSILVCLSFLPNCEKNDSGSADSKPQSAPAGPAEQKRSTLEKIIESPLIGVVKSGEMEAFRGQTVGDAFDEYEDLENKKWDVVGKDVVFIGDVPVHPGSMLGQQQLSFQYKAVFGVSDTSFRLNHAGFLVRSPSLKEPIDIEDDNFEALKLIFQRSSLEGQLMKAAASAGIVAVISGAKRQAVEPKANLTTIIPITANLDQGGNGTILPLKMSENQDIRVAYVPGGDFMIGSTADDPANPDEPAQQAQVHLSSHFWMGVTEITQSQWLLFMETNPSSNQAYRESDDKKDTSNHPVENIFHSDAQLFVNYLQRLRPLPDGWEWALPTEAQWERACREGLGSREWRSVTEEQAWLKTNSGGDDNAYTQPVASKKPNTLGIHDLMGNVMEFTRNVVPGMHSELSGYVDELLGGTDPVGFAPAANLDSDPYSRALGEQLSELQAKRFPKSNGLPIYFHPEHDMLRQRFDKHIYKHLGGGWLAYVLRGGSYTSSKEELHPARRFKVETSARGGDTGFRIVIAKKKLHFERPAVGKGTPGELDGGRAGAGVEYTLEGAAPPFVLRCVPAGEHPLGSFVSHWVGHPKRIVRLAHSFWVAETEMTESQLQALFPSEERGSSPIMPARKVSPQLATSIVAKLNTKKLLPAGWVWALPTTEQWEIACRGGVTDEFAGNLNEMAWYRGDKTQPVKAAHPNAFGLYDMHGNVKEICLRLPPDDTHDKPVHCLKGGSIDPLEGLKDLCSYHVDEVTTAYESNGALSTPHDYGLRLCIIPEEKAKTAIHLVSLDPLNHPESIQKFQDEMSRAAQIGMIFTSTLGSPLNTALTTPAANVPSSSATMPQSGTSTSSMEPPTVITPSSSATMPAIKLEGAADVRLKIAEFEGNLAAVNMRIEAERKRWQEANAVINALTNNGTTPVQRNSAEHVKMYENQVIMKQVEAGAAALKEEKARIEAMLKSLRLN